MSQQLFCANCGIVIDWQPTVVAGNSYCCLGCARGGPCDCDYENLPQPGAVNPIVHQPVAAKQRQGTQATQISPEGD
jgi:hypothetical protein